MKVYNLYAPHTFRYPDDMKKIFTYLEEHGHLHISTKSVEEFYSTFSETEYCASWMEPTDDILAQFAEWLNDINI